MKNLVCLQLLIKLKNVEMLQPDLAQRGDR